MADEAWVYVKLPKCLQVLSGVQGQKGMAHEQESLRASSPNR